MYRIKDQSRFHTLLFPYRLNYDPLPLWKTNKNGLKISDSHLINANE